MSTVIPYVWICESTKPRKRLPTIDSTTFKFPYVIIKLEHNITYTGIL